MPGPGLSNGSLHGLAQLSHRYQRLYNACNKKDTLAGGITGNIFGSQAPASGRGCAGVYMFSAITIEYLAGTMKPMVKGHAYKVSISASLGDSSKWAVNGLGIWFYQQGATSTLTSMNPLTIPGKPQALYPDTIAEKTGWVRLTAMMTADSAYSNLVIGNFLADQDSVLLTPNSGRYAYFFLDSVVVQDAGEIMGIDNALLSNVRSYPNPMVNELTVDGINMGTNIRLMDVMGRTLINTTAITATERINTSALPSGTYILQLRYDGEMTTRKLFKDKM